MSFDDRYYTLSVFQQKPMMNAADWACKYRYMPSTSTMFSFDMSPYFEEPTRYMSDIAETACVIIKCVSQAGKTEALLNILGWICEYDRANTMLVFDTLKSGIKLCRNRIRPYLRDTCGINNPNNSRNKDPDKSNSVFDIGLGRGANLTIASSKSPNDLASNPVKYLLLDELDRYPDELSGEGDPVQLALQRQLRFRGMTVMTSSPTTFENRIYQNFLLGTQQTWGCLCECGAFMSVRYDDIDLKSEVPTYTCKACGQVYTEDDIKGLKHCYSEPKNKQPFTDDFGRIWRSYEVFGTLCHSFYTWSGLRRQEQAAISLGEGSLRSFRNTRLGEIYVEKEETVEITELMMYAKSTHTESTIPDDVAGITLGVDTHDACLYVFTCGFTLNAKKVYALDYTVIPGDPDEDYVWKALNDLMNAEYKTCDGRTVRPAYAFVDSGGHKTAAVYIATVKYKRLRAIKGFVSHQKHAQDPLIGALRKNKIPGYKTKAWTQMLGVTAGKDELALKIKLTCRGDKHLFYPQKECFDKDYFNGLLSEQKIDGKWKQKSERNEPLDTYVYALAAFIYYRNTYIITGKDPEAKEVLEMAKKKKSEIVENNPNNISEIQPLILDEVQEIQPETKTKKSEKNPNNSQNNSNKKFPHM